MVWWTDVGDGDRWWWKDVAKGTLLVMTNGEWLCSRGGGEVEQLWRQKGWWRDGERMSIIAERW